MNRFLTVSMFLCLTRHCLECFDSNRFENVALHKPCTISSRWDETVKPGKAVNGDRSGNFNINNCIHTAYGDRDAWWEVDLGRTYPVQSITIWARDPGEYRMKGCVVFVDERHCFTFTNAPSANERKLEINCSSGILSGPTVRISKNTVGQNVIVRDKYDHTINICEVEVFSCKSAFWGKLCENTCGECVHNSTCDKISGHCSCKPGFLPPLCIMTSCDSGTYGENCSKTCGTGCKNSVCNATSGHCECLPGWKPPLCHLDSGRNILHALNDIKQEQQQRKESQIKILEVIETFLEDQKQMKHMFRSALMSNNVDSVSGNLPDYIYFHLTTLEELESLEINLVFPSVQLKLKL